MNKTVSRVLWIVAGILLIAVGIACFFHPGATLGGLSVALGLAMLFSGLVDIVIFAAARRLMYGAGWFLLDGILTVLLSVFILGNRMFTMMTLPFILGMWLLFSGISMLVGSFDLQRFGMRGWGWLTALGVLLAVFGFSTFFNPVAGAAVLTVMTGLLLILQGAAAIARGCLTGRFWL